MSTLLILAMLLLAAPAGAQDVQITAFGARCDGVTDDTRAIQAAATALPAGASLIFAGPAACRVNGTIVVSVGPVVIRGPGIVEQVCGTCDTFLLRSATAIVIRDLIVNDASGGPSGGWAIAFSGEQLNTRSRISNVQINHTFHGIRLTNAVGYAVYGNTLNARATNIQVDASLSPHSDESRIFGNLFGCRGPACQTHIEINSGGGLEITGNKFLGGTTGIGFDLRASSSSLVIVGNQMENQSASSMDFGCGGFHWGSIVVSGNHLGASRGSYIRLGHAGQASAVCPESVVIVGNESDNAPTHVELQAGRDIFIGSNLFRAGGVGVYAAPGVSVAVCGNFITAAQRYVGGGQYLSACD